MDRAWHPAAEALLGTGERLLAAEEIQRAGGTAPPPPAPSEKRMGPVGWLSTALLHLLSPNLSLPWQDRWENLIFGKAADGHPGSRAAVLFNTRLPVTGMRSLVLVVTDRRFLACLGPEEKFFSLAQANRERLEVIWEVPRSEVRASSVKRYRIRKRLRVDFTDGSWAAFANPLAEPLEPARRLAAALL